MSVTAAILLGLQAINAHAAYTDPAGRATLPSENIVAVSGDDSANVQAAVNRASAKSSGGRIILKKGTQPFDLNNVVLKSNVHIEVEAGTVIQPFGSSGTTNLFVIGIAAGPEIKNISFRGTGGRFKIVYPSAHKNPTRSFLVGNVSNLLIQDVDITENYTDYSAIAFVIQTNGTSDANRAKNVTVANASLTKSLYGYGLVQANSGENMLFQNLSSTDAGVTVRIETDLLVNNTNNIGIDNITANTISCTDGHTAVFLQPHSIANGTVKITGVTAVRCGIAVFIEGNVGRFPGLPDGSFAAGSYVKNIKVTYGALTPISFAKIKYMPLSLRSLVQPKPAGFYDVYQKGPSAAAVVNSLSGQVIVNDSDVTVSGTNLSAYTKKIVTAPIN